MIEQKDLTIHENRFLITRKTLAMKLDEFTENETDDGYSGVGRFVQRYGGRR